ncbi:PIN2/TERF1-interacting telomerase inhibitor 1 [Spea bombifrons]|uniref:PIN2/TERF1-interacting telomerase inhibitor 1 n=1 Tax=Spea bombifrons TaxID=233779 RepID=UPI00234BF6AD|nr:PIN2/TERF1-interacting telomerase inhibitor 1 [Spea bombifrons]
MAMLAEPRRKQKWSVDPRNSTWSKDESKFGQKMLEKMGWSKGKGLGAQEQGSTEHIRVQVKNNTLGLGASVNHEDNWIAHQDDFNQILAELNNFHGGADSDPPPKEEKKSFSLEEKSKSSKKRVHYMKFAKGKDLSCRSDTDLACIFGKREKTKKASPQEEPEVDSKEIEENKSECPSEECESGNTVTSTLSVSEYFAKRMAELKRSRGLKTDPDRPKTTDSADNATKDAVKKPKKKKRDKRGGGRLLPEEQEVPETQESSNSTAECEKPRKKSKKKRKNKEFQPEDAERAGEEEARAPAAANQGEAPQKKKNKRKKSDKRSEDDTPETSAYSAQPKKKKKNKRQFD